MTNEPTSEIVLGKKEESLLRYAIREMADGEQSPIEKAKYWMEMLMPDTKLMPVMYDPETYENPMSAEEFFELMEGRRVELNRTQNEQLQMCMLAFGLRVRSLDHERVNDIRGLVGSIMEKLEHAHGEIWEELPEEQTEEESDENARELVEMMTDMDREEIDEALDDGQ